MNPANGNKAPPPFAFLNRNFIEENNPTQEVRRPSFYPSYPDACFAKTAHVTLKTKLSPLSTKGNIMFLKRL